jgi:indolepyruvate ferredoxin oxidoreductase beta subunit
MFNETERVKDTVSIVIAGVGGQGTILASRLIADVALKQGYDVKISEVHGMAQRGGSVVSQVRYGPKVYSPLIPQGSANYLLGFEKLETLRWLGMLHPVGTVVLNDQIICPLPVLTGAATYPEGIVAKIKEYCSKVKLVDAMQLAHECGSAKASNVVLLGVLAKSMHLGKEEDWLESIKTRVPPNFLEINSKALHVGFNII